MFVLELITSSFLDLISQAGETECRCKGILVTYIFEWQVPQELRIISQISTLLDMTNIRSDISDHTYGLNFWKKLEISHL